MLPAISPQDIVIIRLPSGSFKLITINPNSRSCSLGKFGSFNANDLVGHAYGYTYEIQADKSLKILGTDTLKVLEDEELGNNEFIDDKVQNQVLSHEEIKALRDSGDREALIEKLKENNKSFVLKTEYSKEKYTARKMAKFAPRFTTIPPTTFDLIAYLLDKDADRILHVNQESMGYVLSIADVRPGGHYLVVDDASGVLVAAVLERGGSVTMIHDTEHANLDSLKYFPQFKETGSETGYCRLHTINWEQVADPASVIEELDTEIEKRTGSVHQKDIDKLAKRQALRRTIDTFHKTDFDGALIMSEYTPTSILPHIIPRLGLSRKLVVYAPYREPLLTLRHLDTPELLMPCIAELRAREYQVLQGRTRPVMTKRGEWGFVYHATRVQRLAGAQGTSKNVRAREKQNAETKAQRTKELARTSDSMEETTADVTQGGDSESTLHAEQAETNKDEPVTKRIKLDP